MAGRLLGVFRDELLQLRLGELMVAVGGACPQIGRRKIGPKIGGRHIDDLDGFQPRARRFDVEQNWWLAGLDAAPEFLFGSEEKVLIQRIGMNLTRGNAAGASNLLRAQAR